MPGGCELHKRNKIGAGIIKSDKEAGYFRYYSYVLTLKVVGSRN